jgi:hypothetical protein
MGKAQNRNVSHVMGGAPTPPIREGEIGAKGFGFGKPLPIHPYTHTG